MKNLILSTILVLAANKAQALPQPMVYGVEAIQVQVSQSGTNSEAAGKSPSTYLVGLIPAIRLYSQGFDVSLIKPVDFADKITEQDLARIIPVSELASANSGNVGSKIVDHTIQSYFDSAAVRNSAFGQTAQSVEKKMTQNVTWGAEDATKHEVKMYMKPVHARAVVAYSGFANAQVSYAIATSELNFEVTEKIKSVGADLVLSHVAAPSEIRDTVNMRWNF